MKKRRSHSYRRGSSFFSVLLLTFGTALLMSGYGWVLGILIAYAEKIPGWLFFPLLLLYFGSLLLFGYFVYRRIELRRERSIIGDKAFFEQHPREWKREIRRWKDVDSYRAVSETMDQSELPALLQLGYSASKEEIDALGIALKARTQSDDEPSKGPAGVRHEVAYDELYYRAHPHALKRKRLGLQRRRRIREWLTRTSQEETLYERRLAEIAEKIERN